ncbi:TetR/AcrR family transcriptional regulator [Streptomyces fuscigenes]|uniref:TetR/AcrR family transcriptional regulator n=1 Tax=Streptomyces fuscigenes TaxID=1528880 RepID=UPI001F1A363D|nr:TetR/AcrR family transcriptional regulator [Streptomyces fuscigenes]MCF3962448.1 TetR family transcriptional regulator [Streptomyces fuscigenes]
MTDGDATQEGPGPGSGGPGKAPAPTARRRRDAAATREAILASAVEAFTRHGYAGVGVREIAARAGVTAMLINRYFGSKEKLFEQAVDVAFAPRTVVGGSGRTLARASAEALVSRTAPDADRLGPFLLMLRSVSDPRAAEIVRAGMERHVARDLAERLGGPDARERADLLLSLIAGVWLMRSVVGTRALAEADETRLARRVEAMFAALVDEDGSAGS